MGGAVSAGRDNDDLVDNLCEEKYIVTPEVERVFRMIDRADYMVFNPDEDPVEAYQDHAWRRGNLHLSAPCIYTRAMESLKLEPGLSFLNIGSGTGYLATIAGLLLGATGVNHGIELYPDNIEYAQEKLQAFKDSSPWYDPLTFCEPKFVEGNALLLTPRGMQYDRVYCGAGCPSQHTQLLKNLLKINGILIMPHNNKLEAITKVSETEWQSNVILPAVSFAPLVLPSATSPEDLTALEMSAEVSSLKELSRLQLLRSLGRESYSQIPFLPLPSHLRQYVSFYRDWGDPTAPIKTLCPMEDQADDGEEEADGDNDNGKRKRRRQRDASIGDGAEAMMMLQREINRRRVALVNINGLVFQVPMDSSDDQEDDDEEEEEEEDDDEEEEMLMEENRDNLEAVLRIDPIPDLSHSRT